MTLVCPGDPSCIAGVATTFQSANLTRVRIYGAEARGSWNFTPDWRIDGAIAYAHGTDEDRDQPINSVEPLRASFGIARDAGEWGSEARLRLATKKSRIDDSAGRYFRTPGYGTVDLSAWSKLGSNMRVTAAVNNLLDKKYWLWSDIRQAETTNPAGVDFYTQPGRNFSVALQANF